MIKYDKFEEFNNKLSDSISKHMDIYESIDPSVWKVANINVRYAIEIELYFNFIANIDLFYMSYLARSEVLNHRKFKTDIHNLMLNKQIEPMSILDNINYPIVESLSLKECILFYASSFKHFIYIEHILKSTSLDCCIALDSNNKKLEEYLLINNYTYIFINLDSSKNKIPSHLKGLHSLKLLDGLLDIVNIVKPSVILCSEGVHIQDRILCEIGHSIGAKTICMQHGYAPDYATNFRNFNFNYYLTWGDYFTDGFKEYTNSKTKFISVGNYVLNQNSKNSKNSKMAFFIQAAKYYITQEDYNNFIKLIIYTAKKYQYLEILVREHPSNPMLNKDIDKLKSFQNIRFVNAEEYTLSEVLNEVDIAISISSSSLIEALALGVVPIYINLSNLSLYNRIKKYGNVVMTQSFEEVKEEIDKMITNKRRLNKIKLNNYIFKCIGKDALNNVIAIVDNHNEFTK